MNRIELEIDIKNGMSSYEIANKYNKGQSTISYWIKKFNLKKYKFIKSSPKNAISIKKTRNIDLRGINDNFSGVEKWKNLEFSKLFF